MLRFILLVICVSFFSCSPKIVSKIDNKNIYNVDDIVILDIQDSQPQNADSLGYIKFGDGGLSINCSYEKGIETIKKYAMKNGGNLVKLTELKIPDRWSSCYRIKATIFHVDNNKKYEKIITWSEERKLVYDDFKGKVRPISISSSLSVAVTASMMSYKEKKINPLNFTVKECSIASHFDCKTSWFDENFKNTEVLEHEQLHFDATEIMTRKFRKRLKTNYSKPVLQSVLESEFKTILNEVSQFQSEYDGETDNGRNKTKQAEWKEKINKELKELDAYKSDLVIFGK